MCCQKISLIGHDVLCPQEDMSKWEKGKQEALMKALEERRYVKGS
jgi:hypothetical protein